MTEPTITCPSCRAEIKLTESLAAPLIEATRQEYEQRMAQQDSELKDREAKLKRQQSDIAKAQESIDEQVAAKLNTERTAIVAAEAKKAREALADQLTKAEQEKAAVDDLLRDRDTKLAEAQKNELELRRDRQKLQEEKEQFELQMQRTLDTERTKIRETVQKDADEQSRLKMAEKEKTITDLQSKLQDALRKAEQGSQQLQGEVLELELEALLRANFPHDSVAPVPKGEHGGDVVQTVVGNLGQICGTILWESKRTKNWNDGWLAKLREDQRTAKAEIAVIVSEIRPKDCETFNLFDGIWVTSSRCAIPLTIALRHSMIELATARQAGEGQQTKMEMVYQYLTGPRFRHRIQAVVEKIADMQEDLEKERKNITKQWAKRGEQIRCVIESTAGMYGDLQGIAGKTLQEIEGLGLAVLPSPDSPMDDDKEVEH